MIVVLVAAIPPIVTSYQVAGLYGFLAPRHPLEGIYRVSAFTHAGDRAGAPVYDGTRRWVRLAVSGGGEAMVVQRGDGTKDRAPLTIDVRRGVWTFQTPKDGAVRLEYRVLGSGDVTLNGTVGNGPVQVVLTPQGQSQLLGRGFHWINEYPFNR
jgi:hypothetical protein